MITAADIAQDAEVEIVNSDQYICTVDEGGKIDMEITIGRGRGYKPAKENKQPIIDYIPIDSIYTPVQKVNYNVEPARVGQNIDYDRLTIEVWTDGTFSGREIVSSRQRSCRITSTCSSTCPMRSRIWISSSRRTTTSSSRSSP